jgi:hypothetical protein
MPDGNSWMGTRATNAADGLGNGDGDGDGFDLEDIGEKQLEADAVYAQMQSVHQKMAARVKGSFVGGGWSKMARNTRRFRG